MTPFVSVAAGGVAGMASWASAYPFDLWKSNVQRALTFPATPGHLSFRYFIATRYRDLGFRGTVCCVRVRVRCSACVRVRCVAHVCRVLIGNWAWVGRAVHGYVAGDAAGDSGELGQAAGLRSRGALLRAQQHRQAAQGGQQLRPAAHTSRTENKTKRCTRLFCVVSINHVDIHCRTIPGKCESGATI